MVPIPSNDLYQFRMGTEGYKLVTIILREGFDEKSMNKKKKLKKKQDRKDKKENAHPKAEHAQQEDEKPHDFGGLPHRDLKKNLGCG